jgi:tetratricopeptide (TPR) repeat protein
VEAIFVALIAILALLLVVLGYCIFHAYHGLAPFWLLPRGEYKRAREHYEITLRGAFRFFPWMEDSCAYGIAACLAGEGQMEEALTALRVLLANGRIPKSLRYAVNDRIAGILLHLGRHYAEIDVRLEAALEYCVSPDLLFMRALAQLARGRPADAERSYEQAIALPVPGSKLLGVMVRFGAVATARTALYRGWYLISTQRATEARPFLVEATRLPQFAEFARGLLELAPPFPDDDRPSLLPVTVSPK